MTAMPLARLRSVARATGVARFIGLDLFPAHILADGLLVRDGFLVQADTLHGHGFLLHHGPFLVQSHLVLLLAYGRAAHRFAPVGISDRLTLDPHLFARAFAELAETGDAAAVELLADATLCLARGEALQRRQTHRPDTTVDGSCSRARPQTWSRRGRR